MKSGGYNSFKRSRNKRTMRRIGVVSLFLVVIGLSVLLGWQVVRGIKAITTGEQPISAPPHTSQTTSITTTTTHPTIAVNATLSSPRVVVYDVTHSALMYSQNADMKCYPASLTKLLTAIIATEECTSDEEFVVGSEISLVQKGSSLAYLEPGFRMTRDMIIDAMLLPSGNDAAYSIAAHIGRKLSGNPEISDLEALFAFTDKMNQKAHQLGAVNSHFTNPDGFFSPDHYTTAADMLEIAKAAIKYDNLKQTMAKTSARHTLLSGQDMVFKNSNAILNPSSPFYFEGATGMKTGWTNEAGHCVIVSAKKNGVEVIAVVMGGSSSNGRWQDAVNLLSEAFAAHN